MRRFLSFLISVVLLTGVARAAVIHIDVEKYDDPSDFGVIFNVQIKQHYYDGGWYPTVGFYGSYDWLTHVWTPLHGDSFRRTVWVEAGIEIEAGAMGQDPDWGPGGQSAKYWLYVRDLNENTLADYGPGQTLALSCVVPVGLPDVAPAAYLDWYPTNWHDIYINGAFWGHLTDTPWVSEFVPFPLVFPGDTLIETDGGRTPEAYLYDKDMVLVDSSFVASPSDPDNYLSYLVPDDSGSSRRSGFCGGTPLLMFVWLLAYRRRRGW